MKTTYWFASYSAKKNGERGFGSSFTESTQEHAFFPAQQFLKSIEQEQELDPGTIILLYYRQISKKEYEVNKNCYK